MTALEPHHAPTRRFTVQEVKRMVEAGILREDERIELIEGRLCTVSPQGPDHSYVTLTLAARLRGLYGIAMTVREEKPLDCGADSLPEPDIAVVVGEPTVHRDQHPRGDECVLVVEVAKTSQASDQAKAAVYAKAGVPEYWLVDLAAYQVVVHRALADGRYGDIVTLAGDGRLSLGDRGSFTVEELLA